MKTPQTKQETFLLNEIDHMTLIIQKVQKALKQPPDQTLKGLPDWALKVQTELEQLREQLRLKK